MARTNVPRTAVPKSASVLQASAVTLDPTNGHVIPAPTGSGHVILDIDSTFAGAKTFTIKASPWAPAGELGDVVISLNAQRALVLLESSRVFQVDGTILIDVQAGATGSIRCYGLPY
jgi:hypothetical protein